MESVAIRYPRQQFHPPLLYHRLLHLHRLDQLRFIQLCALQGQFSLRFIVEFVSELNLTKRCLRLGALRKIAGVAMQSATYNGMNQGGRAIQIEFQELVVGQMNTPHA
jgi:hypothetical protein